MTDAPLPSTIAAPVEQTFEVKKSVFLARLEPVASLDEADLVVARVRKAHWDARHHCTAMVVGSLAERQRSNDDGEPPGTAGAPMLEVLRHRAMTDVVAVVTRWFGGTLLGTGGLIRAYGSAVSGALDGATVVERVRLARVSTSIDHADSGRVLAYLHQWAAAHRATLEEAVYDQAVAITIRVPPAELPLLADDVAAFSGGAVTLHIGETAVHDRVAG